MWEGEKCPNTNSALKVTSKKMGEYSEGNLAGQTISEKRPDDGPLNRK